MTKFIVRDSGKRTAYESGMVRDTQDGKPDYRLIPTWFLTQLADHLTKGAKKYGADNWQLACSSEEARRFESSAMRHLVQLLNGETDEDHMSAVVFNVMALTYTREQRAFNVPTQVRGFEQLQLKFEECM